LKKIIPYLVIWVFLSGSGGYFIVFKIKQFLNACEIKREITNNQKDKVRQELVFNLGEDAGVKWIKYQKEFIYKGQMYDVAKVVITGKQIHYYCINDTKEKQLITGYKNSSRASGQSKKIFRKVTSSQFILYSFNSKAFRFISPCCFSQPVCLYMPPIGNTLSPPPEKISIS